MSRLIDLRAYGVGQLQFDLLLFAGVLSDVRGDARQLRRIVQQQSDLRDGALHNGKHKHRNNGDSTDDEPIDTDTAMAGAAERIGLVPAAPTFPKGIHSDRCPPQRRSWPLTLPYREYRATPMDKQHDNKSRINE
jgi:hypothetical protein